jgi:site-specific recombinase XerD
MNTTFNLWVNNRPNAKGSYDIFIRVTQSRKHKHIKTGLTVNQREDFNKNAKQSNWIRGRGENTKSLNASLADKLNAVKLDMAELHKRVKNPSKESIILKYRGESSADFISFLKRIIKRFNDSGAHRTGKRYTQLLNKLTAFESDAIPFDSITVTFLKNFESYLSELHQNTRYEHFKNMKAAFNQAIQEDIISNTQNPFLRFKVKQIPTSKEKLSIKEIHAINKLKLQKDSALNHTRNCFMFSFYCGGIRAGDIMMLRWNSIEEGKLSYVMSKNRNSKLTKRTIPLIAEAAKILKQYQTKDTKPDQFIFGELDKFSKLISDDKRITSGHEKKIYNKIASRNAILNKNLKKLAEAAKITKTLTMHISRHSFSQYAINKGMSPKILQTILGHEKFATTEIYINGLDDKNVQEGMLKIFA